MSRRIVRLAIASVLGLSVSLAAQERVDSAVNAKIRDEGLNRSKVGALFTHLVDTIGPRLAGSPEYKRSAEWARDTMKSWGLANVALEPFEFGRGWALEKFTIEMVEPRYMPLVGFPEAWSPSTSGEVVAPIVVLAGKTADAVEATKGSMKGAAILSAAAISSAAGRGGFIRTDRAQPADAPEVAPSTPVVAPTGRGAQGGAPGRQGGAAAGRQGGAAGGPPSDAQRITAAINTSGVAVLLKPSRGEHGTLFVQAGRDNAADPTPKVVLIGEHYNMLMRLAQQGVPVKVRVNVQSRFLDADRNSYNVLAEIPGTDPALKDEVVMLGAHLDSWHTAVGATDNADGSAVAMEAFRILKTIGAAPRRTLRLALWGAEEEGLLGSAAYVRKHLAGDENRAAREKLAVYFNIDPGKGPIYGWFLENNAAVRPVFDAWLEPFKDLGAKRNVLQGIGSTDHLSFIRAGMPGFNPVQDYVGYDVREHHTNVDTPERIREGDLQQNAIILASFIYHASMRTERLPGTVLGRRPAAGMPPPGS